MQATQLNQTASTRAAASYQLLRIHGPEQVSDDNLTDSGLTQLTLVDRSLVSRRGTLADLQQHVFPSQDQAIAYARDWAIEKLSEQTAGDDLMACEILHPIVATLSDVSEEDFLRQLSMQSSDEPHALGIERVMKRHAEGASRDSILEFIDAALMFLEDDLTEVRAAITPVMVADTSAADSLPVDPAAVADWLVHCLAPSDCFHLTHERVEAEQQLIEAFDELVFQHIGTSRSVSDGINNRGLEAQVEALLRSGVYGEAPLGSLVAELSQELEGFQADASTFDAWVSTARETLVQSVCADEADNMASVVLSSSPGELRGYARSDLGLSEKSYAEVREMAMDRGLLDG